MKTSQIWEKIVHSNAKNHINGHLFIWHFLFPWRVFRWFFVEWYLLVMQPGSIIFESEQVQKFLEIRLKKMCPMKYEKQLWFCLKIRYMYTTCSFEQNNIISTFRRNHGKGSHQNKMKFAKNRGRSIVRTYFYHKVCRHFIVRDCMLRVTSSWSSNSGRLEYRLCLKDLTWDSWVAEVRR